MEILDTEIKEKPEKTLGLMHYFLGIVFLLGFGIEVSTIYHLVELKGEYPVCSWNPYPLRFYVHFIFYSGFIVVASSLLVSRLTFPKVLLEQFLLVSPILLFLGDKIVFLYLYLS